MEPECSSDDDLAWSNASSDYISGSEEISNMKSNKHDHESESGLESKKYDKDNGLEEEKKKKKAKKRKHEEELYEKDDYQPVEKKIIKIEPASDKDKSESEENSQSDSFVNLRVKQENAPDEIRSKKKKKHQKIKEESSNESKLIDNTEESYNTTVNESVVEEKKKKKKHKKNIEEESYESELLDNTEENHSTIVTEPEENEIKKKKKHKKIKEESRNGFESLDNAEENYNTTAQEPVEDETMKKKKHKKNKEESIEESESLDNTEDNFNKTMNESVEGEMKKKKKKRKSEHNSELEENRDRSTSKNAFKRTENIENSDDNKECDKIYNEDRSIVASSTFLENMPMTSKMDIDSNINDVSAITSTASKKTTRISDRLKFEDDDVVNSIINGYELDTDLSSTKEVITFLNSNTSLVPLKSFTTFNADDDDIWILKCPTEISINDFKDYNLVLDGKSKLKINGQTYDGNIDESDCNVTVVTYSKKKAFLKNLSVLKTITFRKRIPVPHIQDDSIVMSSQTSFITLPDTKCRHPLFGTNYKKAIKVSKPVMERLAESKSQPQLEEDVYKKKKKKHKKEKNIEKISKAEHVKEEPEEQSIPEESPIKKKKRKHKIKEENDIIPAKRIKLEQNPEAWESEKAIEENLFNF